MTVRRKGHRRHSRRVLGWEKRQTVPAHARERDPQLVLALRVASIVGGYVYRKPGGPWKVGGA